MNGQQLILIRGLPGSGKSTLANELQSHAHCEADKFFEDFQGDYHYDASKIKAAHEYCIAKAYNHLRLNQSVVVSNTFVKLWQLEPYFNMARTLQVSVQVIECKANFGSIHNAPQEVIERMRAEWEEYK